MEDMSNNAAAPAGNDSAIDTAGDTGSPNLNLEGENTLLAGGQTQQQQQQQTQVQAQQKDADPLDAVPEKADGYTLDHKAFADADPAIVHLFKTEAHSLGLSQKQAKGLADFYQKAEAAQMQNLQTAKTGWEADIMNRPTFQKDITDARRVLAQYGSQEMIQMMNETALGSHPVFYDFMVKVGKALAEPETRGGGANAVDNRPLAEKLWPGMQ